MTPEEMRAFIDKITFSGDGGRDYQHAMFDRLEAVEKKDGYEITNCQMIFAKQYLLLADAPHKELFKHILEQERKAWRTAEFRTRASGTWMQLPIDGGDICYPEDFEHRLPLPLPELKPLPCAVKNFESVPTTLMDCTGSYYVVAVNSEGAKVQGPHRPTKEAAILAWNQLQIANGATYGG